MSNDTTYNGWTNYETWCVNLWLTNEQDSDSYWRDAAQECWDDADAPSANARLTGHEPFTRDEKAAMALADRLKAEHQESMPELEGFWADMLNAALGEVDWHEIATDLLQGVNKTEDTESDDDE